MGSVRPTPRRRRTRESQSPAVEEPAVEERVRGLTLARLRLHRLSPPRPIRDAAEAAAFVHERKIVMSVGRSGLAVLSDAIAGRRLPGSWMGHPETTAIYNIFVGLGRSALLDARLVAGKSVLMDPALGPVVARLAGDPERRADIERRLAPLARRLLRRVEADGAVRMDSSGIPSKEGRAARTALERALLVVSEEFHTERGSHTVVVRPWRAGRIAASYSKETGGLTLAMAQDTLLEASLQSAVLAPEREVAGWFDFARECVEALVTRGRIERLATRDEAWLTLSDTGREAGPPG